MGFLIITIFLIVLGIIITIPLLVKLGVVLAVFFWFFMIISVLRNRGISETARWVWFGLMIGLAYLYGTGWIVTIVYYFTDRKKG